jgi:hypothetical protein
MNVLAFPVLAGGKREKERRGGESIHSSTPAQGLLNGIPYVKSEREERRVDNCPTREKNKNFLDSQCPY